jgi:hypothetical protein
MKRKAVAKNKTELAALLAKLDGERIGLSRADARLALKLMETLETALIVRGYKSACLIIRRNAKRKAEKMK